MLCIVHCALQRTNANQHNNSYSTYPIEYTDGATHIPINYMSLMMMLLLGNSLLSKAQHDQTDFHVYGLFHYLLCETSKHHLAVEGSEIIQQMTVECVSQINHRVILFEFIDLFRGKK